MANKSGKRSRNPMGRPLMLGAEQISQLVSITEEQPHISMDDLVFMYRRRTGTTISKTTAKKYLERAADGAPAEKAQTFATTAVRSR